MGTPTDQAFTPLRREKLTDLVVSQIKNLIFSKGIEVGEKLPSERELAGRLKISRSAVREGLSSLEQSGFVEIRRGRAAGAYVVDDLYKPFYHSTTDLLRSGKIEIQQFFEARMAIECFAIRMVARRIGEVDLERLTAMNEELTKGPHDVSRLIEYNSRFHVTLAELSGNQLIKMMLQSLMRLMADMGFGSSRPSNAIKTAYRSHADIIEALRQRDVDRCERLLAANIELSKELRCRENFGRAGKAREGGQGRVGPGLLRGRALPKGKG